MSWTAFIGRAPHPRCALHKMRYKMSDSPLRPIWPAENTPRTSRSVARAVHPLAVRSVARGSQVGSRPLGPRLPHRSHLRAMGREHLRQVVEDLALVPQLAAVVFAEPFRDSHHLRGPI